jgi:chromosome segregation ATPase
VISVGLAVALIWSQRRAAQQANNDADSIAYYSNQLVQTSARLDQLRLVNTALEGDLKSQREAYTNLAEALARLSSRLEAAEASLKSAQEELARRDFRIANLEAQIQAMDQRVDRGGAEQLMQKSPATNRLAQEAPGYDSSVEVSSDGGVRIVPPSTNRPAAPVATNSASAE